MKEAKASKERMGGGKKIGQTEELESGYILGLSKGKMEVWMERMLKTHM